MISFSPSSRVPFPPKTPAGSAGQAMLKENQTQKRSAVTKTCTGVRGGAVYARGGAGGSRDLGASANGTVPSCRRHDTFSAVEPTIRQNGSFWGGVYNSQLPTARPSGQKRRRSMVPPSSARGRSLVAIWGGRRGYGGMVACRARRHAPNRAVPGEARCPAHAPRNSRAAAGLDLCMRAEAPCTTARSAA